MKNLKFITKILHNKFLREDPYGSMHMPVYDNVAFEFKTAEELEQAFLGKNPGHMYSRITNPTVEHLEQRIRAVTDAAGVIALSSGMAAITNAILAIAGSGDNIVTSKHLFGNTYSLFEKTLKSWGLEARYTDLTQPDLVKGLVDDKTKAIFFETITNPQLEVVSIKVLSKLALERGILLIADTTLTPPYVFNSGEFGVDIEILSSTKYMSGGATSVGGIIIDNGKYDWRKNSKLKDDAKKYGPSTFINKLRSEVYRNLGSCLSPHNAFLQSVGLETLPLRVDTSCVNVQKIAEFLEKCPRVKSVNYPGLKSSKYYKIAKEQFGDKTGSLLTFDLRSKEECFTFMDKLRLIRRATNLQDNRTLILHPASTIFCEYSDDLKREMGVRETMIRLSAGIEDARDLIFDIKGALEGLK
ncbi:MAG: PLP-dependent transferase [Candidatus Omnitrophica bacterium]|nr:PLP-dependent transferase [Candidatus Omnitrophota bacterium]MBU1128064.1 PLP-dependent transferase [Candidatus Omnitrophota bacterium]MBU1783922.1 PLP-dependent transferase [Candidatus Omnitrophota bacterium]MBU1851063.1 PLP-dependent transferase [Candidatus Omnitrophota bacterium]